MNGRAFTILMVEDDPAHAEIIRRNFAGFRVANRLLHLGDGQQALDYFHAREDADHPLPNLILLDLRLPRVDGFEVLHTLKDTPGLRDIPVIVLSTSASARDIARAYDLGANSYLVKPVGFREFCGLMNTLGDYWLAWNRYPN